MDDSHTRKMLDSLADLFLTGAKERSKPSEEKARCAPPAVRPSSAPPQRPELPQQIPHQITPPVGSPTMTKTNFTDQLQGPAPIRLSPKVVAAVEPEDEHWRTELENEMLADAQQGGPPLRLSGQTDPVETWTEPAPPSTPKIAASKETLVEAVFLGSLPGFAGPWLTQYAQHRCASCGAVGVVYLDETLLDIELVVSDPSDDLLLPAGLTLIQAIEQLPQVGLWLINASPDASPELIDRLDSINTWTVLCGADDTATVGAYRLIRKLIEQTTPVIDDRPTRCPRAFNLMVMGAGEQKAQHAADQINLAVANLLERPVEFLGGVRQMSPVNMRVVGTFDNNAEQWSAALQIMQQQRADVNIAADQPSIALADAQQEQAMQTPLPQNAVESIPFPPPADDADQPVEQPAVYLHPTPIKPVVQPPTPVAPTPATPAAATPSNPVDLSVHLLDAIAIEARCPKHPDVQLTLDQRGQLHLLARHTGDPACLQHVIVKLIEARQWVTEHRSLLQLTQRQCRFDSEAQPTPHLFTDQAKQAAALAVQLGASVKLHLLQSITVAGQTTWFCAELN